MEWVRTGGNRGDSVTTNLNLYFTPNNIRVIKSRRTEWAGHVARGREEKRIWETCVHMADRREIDCKFVGFISLFTRSNGGIFCAL